MFSSRDRRQMSGKNFQRALYRYCSKITHLFPTFPRKVRWNSPAEPCSSSGSQRDGTSPRREACGFGGRGLERVRAEVRASGGQEEPPTIVDVARRGSVSSRGAGNLRRVGEHGGQQRARVETEALRSGREWRGGAWAGDGARGTRESEGEGFTRFGRSGGIGPYGAQGGTRGGTRSDEGGQGSNPSQVDELWMSAVQKLLSTCTTRDAYF
ncbi:hypothetical protein DFH09DRAFT_1285572 [Mycena vulgaris]|nr:hypothetical protein DFH09DRAFT_1285572 [Mycena vulgaris]